MLPWSGEALVWGREIEASGRWHRIGIHIFGLVSSGLLKSKKKLQRVEQFDASCDHFAEGRSWLDFPGVCPVEVAGRRYVAAACFWCHQVELTELTTGAMSRAYLTGSDDGDFRPLDLCLGEPGKLWMVRLQMRDRGTLDGEFDVVELDCTDIHFTPTGRGFPIPELKSCNSFCYFPPPYNSFVFSDSGPNRLLSVDAESGEKLWEFSGRVEGAHISCWGVTFFPEHQVVLLADRTNFRLLVLEPSSGCPLQTLPLPEKVGDSEAVGCHNEHLFLISSLPSEDRSMLSCFSLT